MACGTFLMMHMCHESKNRKLLPRLPTYYSINVVASQHLQDRVRRLVAAVLGLSIGPSDYLVGMCALSFLLQIRGIKHFL